MPLAEMPQVNKQHAVPQNIMEVEFKLVGDLTMRQFAYLIVFGGLAYGSTVLVVGVFKMPIAFFFAALAFGLAFIPIQDRGLDEWIVNFLRAVYGPSQRIWRKEPTIPSAFVYENLNVVRQEMIALAPTSSRRKLEEYLHYQNTQVPLDPLDIPEAAYINKVRDAYANVSTGTDTDQSSVSVGVLTSEPEEADMTDEMGSLSPLPSEQADRGVTEEGKSQEEPRYGATDATPQTERGSEEVTKKETPLIKHPHKRTQHFGNEKPSARFNAAPITPDMHAGRRFTNLLPTGGEIILPIRGERVIKTAEEVDIEGDIQDKAARLKMLLSQIKRTSGIFGPAQNIPAVVPAVEPSAEDVVPPVTEVSSEAENLVNKLKEENETITKKIDTLKSEAAIATENEEAASKKEAMIHELEVQKQRTQEDYARLEMQVLDLQKRLQEKQTSSGPDTHGQPVKPVYARIQPLSTAPNVVTGIINKSDGTVAEGLILVIKNDHGDIVRAFKSNSLGQFSLITPLQNGIYTLEISRDEKSEGMTFDIISVEAKGEPIPPFEITGKAIQ